MKNNDWQRRFGAKRRAIDKALLAECERQIAAEEKSPPAANYSALNGIDVRQRIAAAFGRPAR